MQINNINKFKYSNVNASKSKPFALRPMKKILKLKLTERKSLDLIEISNKLLRVFSSDLLIKHEFKASQSLKSENFQNDIKSYKKENSCC